MVISRTVAKLDPFVQFCINQHDNVINQKYGKDLKYSFHLYGVFNQYRRFSHLLPEDRDIHMLVVRVIFGHDIIEDDPNTNYSDVKRRSTEQVADIIFGCTESTGRTRQERHDDAYFKRMTENDYSIFAKLCDMISNVLFSLYTNSSMFEKYKLEYPNFKRKTYRNSYNEMYDFLETLLIRT